VKEPDRLFVVVDPAHEYHVALHRAIITSLVREDPSQLHIFIVVDGNTVDTHATNDNLFRGKEWLDTLLRSVAETGIRYEVTFCWSGEWHKAILRAAGRFNPRTILLPVLAGVNEHRFAFSAARWDLLRKARCPVLLVRPGASESRNNVLAAVNFQHNSGPYRKLNDRIIERGHWLASHYRAVLHTVNAYTASMDYPDYGQLAKRTRLSSERIFVRPGSTAAVITETAQEIGADIVVIGTRSGNGLGAMIRGNTAERIAGKLLVDLMVVTEI
jgi:universal stress protein E